MVDSRFSLKNDDFGGWDMSCVVIRKLMLTRVGEVISTKWLEEGSWTKNKMSCGGCGCGFSIRADPKCIEHKA